MTPRRDWDLTSGGLATAWSDIMSVEGGAILRSAREHDLHGRRSDVSRSSGPQALRGRTSGGRANPQSQDRLKIKDAGLSTTRPRVRAAVASGTAARANPW